MIKYDDMYVNYPKKNKTKQKTQESNSVGLAGFDEWDKSCEADAHFFLLFLFFLT